VKQAREIGAGQFIEDKLREFLLQLEKRRGADVITFFGPLLPPVDNVIRSSVEEIKKRKKTLLMILETDGGEVEVVQRIAETLRRHYKRVEFIVPNHAMSAGTVLVMSGDEIWMDYYAVLGPIDPQVRPRQGRASGAVPALGYLVQYERLLEKANTKNGLNTAEMAILLQFDPAELYRYEQARNLSIRLLKQWLVKYKFRNWKKTRTRSIPVTRKMRLDRAEQVAEKLNDIDRWHTHGRGISMQVLRKDLGLEISDFEKDKELSREIREYYTLLSDYLLKLGMEWVIHTREIFVPIGGR